ncbi:MAG: hypothetical protein H6R18_1524 [Proteobacteria bacterium]|nr:hypothetical protein [Pseudomonadota bacterium]
MSVAAMISGADSPVTIAMTAMAVIHMMANPLAVPPITTGGGFGVLRWQSKSPSDKHCKQSGFYQHSHYVLPQNRRLDSPPHNRLVQASPETASPETENDAILGNLFKF